MSLPWPATRTNWAGCFWNVIAPNGLITWFNAPPHPVLGFREKCSCRS
jgi:hypothetical protein